MKKSAWLLSWLSTSGSHISNTTHSQFILIIRVWYIGVEICLDCNIGWCTKKGLDNTTVIDKLTKYGWYFIEGLPKSKRFDTILVVIDKLTKYGHFIPRSHPYTAMSIAQLFHNNIYKLHGLPQTIISDRDRVFTSTLWQHLFKLAKTTLNMSSSYHPQTDGNLLKVHGSILSIKVVQLDCFGRILV